MHLKELSAPVSCEKYSPSPTHGEQSFYNGGVSLSNSWDIGVFRETKRSTGMASAGATSRELSEKRFDF